MSTQPCPSCHRPNRLGRDTCLYCAAAMPESDAPQQVTAKGPLPADLDALVARALAGGGMGDVVALRTAIEKARGDAPTPTAVPGPLPVAAPTWNEDDEDAPTPAPAAPADAGSDAPDGAAPAAAPPDPTAQTLAIVASQAAQAQDAWTRGDPDAARTALAAVQARVHRLLPELARAAAPPVALPPVHKDWALVVDGLGDGDRALDLAGALDVDVATARQIALSRAPRVARRGDDDGPLRPLLDALQRAGIRAALVHRDALLALPPAALVVGLDVPGRGPGASPWRLTWSDRWTRAHAPEAVDGADHGTPCPPPRPFLAVPGEVVVTKHAAGRDLGRMTHKRHQHERSVGESRVPVLDLHAADAVLRLTPGLTDLRGWVPGQQGGLQAWKALLDRLPDLFPGIAVAAARTVSPTRDRPLTVDGAVPDGRIQALGAWPGWEEHSRLCRMLQQG
ncbi:MAG: hypothetical protein H6742_04155 [Alphaproteobacteria bacterium]|nr:hypothetical protein [Alphaproteobacteria bacterium]